MIDNLLTLAESEYEAGQLEKTEDYCDQIIVKDQTEYKAWFLKGKARGWQTSLRNPRLKEAVNFFRKAYDYVPDGEKESFRKKACDEYIDMFLGYNHKMLELFLERPYDKEMSSRLTNSMFRYLEDLGVLFPDFGEGVISLNADQFNKIYDFGIQAGLKLYDAAKPYYNFYDRNANVKWGNSLIYAQGPISLCNNVFIDIGCFANETGLTKIIDTEKKAIRILQEVVDDNNKYKKHIENVGLSREYWEVINNIDHANSLFEKTISEYEALIKKCETKKAEARKKRIESYWKEHSDEKDKLETEKKQLVEKKEIRFNNTLNLNKMILDLKSELKNKVPSEEKADSLKNQISELERRRANLGIFKSKEKRQIDLDIASIRTNIESLNSKIAEEKGTRFKEVQQKLQPIQSKYDEQRAELKTMEDRIAEIDAELTKDREG